MSAADALIDWLLMELCWRPTGVSEYHLLRRLAGEGRREWTADLSDSLTLFQRHFLLFHCLYRLRERLRREGELDLTIHCLCIRLLPAVTSRRGLPVPYDALAAYYLDIGNLTRTSAQDVAQMLDSFWQRFSATAGRIQALAVLGLDETASYPDIRRRYRKLAMTHHPDRGGDRGKFQQISAAMETLAHDQQV